MFRLRRQRKTTDVVVDRRVDQAEVMEKEVDRAVEVIEMIAGREASMVGIVNYRVDRYGLEYR